MKIDWAKWRRLATKYESLRAPLFQIGDEIVRAGAERSRLRSLADAQRRGGDVEVPHVELTRDLAAAEKRYDQLLAERDRLQQEIRPLGELVARCEKWLKDRGLDPSSELSPDELEAIDEKTRAEWNRRATSSGRMRSWIEAKI